MFSIGTQYKHGHAISILQFRMNERDKYLADKMGRAGTGRGSGTGDRDGAHTNE